VKRKRTLLEPAARRQQLLAAAVWVFARKGYRNASISHIIARAGVARGTFYLHFKSKEQLFLAIVEDFYGLVKRALEDTPTVPTMPAGAGPQALLQASFRQWLGFFAASRDPRFGKGFASLRHLAHSHFSARIHHLQTLGVVTRAVSADFIAHLQLGMFDALLNAFVLTDPDADLDALAADLAVFEWNGLRPMSNP
jgi:AcrR family transcriptional regulator